MNGHELKKILANPKIIMDINYSFSQEGEDMIVDNLLEYKENGFYIDLGAHHPTRFSNTMRFYCRGWTGINIDATPGSMQMFQKLRPKDINIEAGISATGDTLTYYEFEDSALNTFDVKKVEWYEDAGYVLKGKRKIKTYKIMELLDQYLINVSKNIDILDIDIEGFDELIIESWDWEKYCPTIVMTEKEINERDMIISNNILLNNGYELVASTGRTAIYLQKSNS